MEYKLKDEDYLELWKYFQDKATSVKGTMFNTITWIVGFAAALLGFLFTKLTDFESANAEITLPKLMILVSMAGLVICLYAFFVLSESAKHIRNNWHYADCCLKKIEGLDKIVFSRRAETKDNLVKIWNQLQIVVSLFLAAFVAVLVWAFTIMETSISP